MKLEHHKIVQYYVTVTKTKYMRVYSFNFKPICAELMKDGNSEVQLKLKAKNGFGKGHVKNTVHLIRHKSDDGTRQMCKPF